VRRTQINQFAWRTDIEHRDLLNEDHPARRPDAYRLKFDDQEKLGIKLVQLHKPYIREDIDTPSGLLAVLLKKVIPA